MHTITAIYSKDNELVFYRTDFASISRAAAHGEFVLSGSAAGIRLTFLKFFNE